MHQNFPLHSEDQVPINFTSDVGDTSLVKLILGKMEEVAKSTFMQVDDFIGANAFVDTPIFSATWGNHIDVVKLLMNYAKNSNSPRDSDGVTPIYIAAYKNHIELVELLKNSTEIQMPQGIMDLLQCTWLQRKTILKW